MASKLIYFLDDILPWNFSANWAILEVYFKHMLWDCCKTDNV